MLELIDKGSCSDAHPAPLLFVHGAWHAAWCWDDHFLDYFADEGFRAVAISLRGHGGSVGSKSPAAVTFANHVDDIRSAVELLDSECVLIGHSLGGLVVQKYLESRRALAAVLLAPHPPQRMRRAAVALRAVMNHPLLTIRANTVGTFADLVNTPQSTRDAFFCPRTPQAIVESCARRVESGSKRAGAGGMLVRVRPSRVTTPVLVLDGDQDSALTEAEVRAIAAAYGTEPVFFSGMGHNMMLEPEWSAVATCIRNWLGTHQL